MLEGLLFDHEEQGRFYQTLFRVPGGGCYFFRLRSEFRILIFNHFQEIGMHFSHVRAAPRHAWRRGIGCPSLQGRNQAQQKGNSCCCIEKREISESVFHILVIESWDCGNGINLLFACSRNGVETQSAGEAGNPFWEGFYRWENPMINPTVNP